MTTVEEDNVIPLSGVRKRSRPLKNPAALAWLRARGRIEIESYTALGAVFGWERSRTSKAVKAWEKAGQVEVQEAGSGGKITLVVPGLPAGKPSVTSRETDREANREIPAVDREIERETEREIPAHTVDGPRETQPLDADLVPAGVHGAMPSVPAPAPTALPDDSFSLGERFILAMVSAAALGLELVPVYFAVKGFTTLFPGEALAVFFLAVVIDGAKLGATWFTAAFWNRMSLLAILLLVAFVAIAATINGVSVYGQLTAAHVTERTVAQADAVADANRDVVRLEATVMVQRRVVNDVQKQIEAHDAAVSAEIAAKPKAATRIVEDGSKKRAALAAKLESESRHLGDLVAQEAEANATSLKTATRKDADAAPIAYLAKVFGIDTSDQDRIFRWEVIAIVAVADPFALALMWAIGSVNRRRRS